MPLPWQEKKTISELEEEDAEESLKLSIAQKRALQNKLKEAGASRGMFSSWSAALQWLKTH